MCGLFYHLPPTLCKLDLVPLLTLIIIIMIIVIVLHGLGRLNCSDIDALPSFPGASTISSSWRFVFEGVFRESGVVHSFKVVDPVLFVFESHVLYSTSTIHTLILNNFSMLYHIYTPSLINCIQPDDGHSSIGRNM